MLVDDGIWTHRFTEEFGSNFRHGCVSRFIILGIRHRCRRADAQNLFLARKPVLDPTNQHGHIRTLTAAICVEFIENQELQTMCVLDYRLIEPILTSQQEFKHHEVCEQYIRLEVRNFLPPRFSFLTGVARKSWPQFFIDAGRPDEFLQFFKLAVGQCVHGIDDDRSGLWIFASATRPHDRVDDRNEETKRFAGASSRCDDKALATLRLCDGPLLMPM